MSLSGFPDERAKWLNILGDNAKNCDLRKWDEFQDKLCGSEVKSVNGEIAGAII